MVVNDAIIQAGAPNNPFQGPIATAFPGIGRTGVAISNSNTIGVTGGVIFNLKGGWKLSLDHAWSRANVNGRQPFPRQTPDASAAIADGTLNVLRDLSLYPATLSRPLFPELYIELKKAPVTMNDSNLRLSGPLLRLPGGDLTFTTLFEHRVQRAAQSFQSTFDGFADPLYNVRPKRSQKVDSFYAELAAPVVAPKNKIPAVYRLDLQASVRKDFYTTRSISPSLIGLVSPTEELPELTQSTNKVQATRFTVGGSWAPLADIQLRASYATAFLPPAIDQILAPLATPSSIEVEDDPKRGFTSYFPDVTLVDGGNPDLLLEDSKTFSAGVILTPTFMPGFRFSADYIDIKKTNEIIGLDTAELLQNEALFPNYAERGPLTPEDIEEGYTAGEISLID